MILATGYAELKPGAGKGMRKLSKPFTEGDLAAELARVPRLRNPGRVIPLRNGSPSRN